MTLISISFQTRDFKSIINKIGAKVPHKGQPPSNPNKFTFRSFSNAPDYVNCKTMFWLKMWIGYYFI